MRACGRVAGLVVVVTAGVFARAAQGADEPGKPAYHFLNLGTSARLEALGTTGTTLGEHCDAMDWNPARLAHVGRPSASAAWFSWLEGVQGTHLAAAFPVGTRGAALGVTVRALGVEEFENTDAEDPVSQSDLAFAVGGSMPLANDLAAGVSLKLVTSDVAEESATGFAADAGLDYAFTRGWNLACAARHLGPGFAYGDGVDNQLPTQIAAGFAGTTRKFRYGVEGVWENGPGLGSAVGIEYSPLARLALRGGTRLDSKPESAVEPWSAGAGFEVGAGLSVDYAFRDGKIEPSHRLGLRWEPGRGAAPDDAGVRSGPEFYRRMLAEAIAPALASLPASDGDSVVVRPAKEHEAADVACEVVAELLRGRGLRPEVRKAVPDLPDSIRAARAADLARMGLTTEVDLPLVEVEVKKSGYNYVRTKRDRWVGPRSVEREVSVDAVMTWRLPGEPAPSWTTPFTGSDRETVEMSRIPSASGYPQPTSPSTEGGKPNPFVEPAIVTGIVAGLAFLFFSNRDVGN